MMDDILIELKGISKRFVLNDSKFMSTVIEERRKHKTDVLDNIDLTIRKGDVVALMGRNGCGKTTLMKIIAGLIAPTEGQLRVNGRMVCIIESGTMFNNDDTGYQNIIYRGLLYGMSKKEILGKMDDIARFAEIDDALNKPVRTYSLGMKSRLGFAIMAHVDADIYILDEALNAGDSIFGGKAVKFINQLALAGKTVVMTSHSGTILRDVCNRAILIEKGRIVADAQYNEVNAKYRRTLMSSAETMQEAAESGNSSVQYMLAKKIQDSSPAEYEALLKEASDGRLPVAMIEYADLLYDKGEKEMAKNLYKMAATSGDRSGMYRYAMSSLSGEMDKGLPLASEVLKNGDHFDKYRYSLLLKEVALGTDMHNKSYKLFEESFSNGNRDAGYEIAQMKLIGNGTTLDVDDAISILVDNAENGHMKSAKMLYRLYSDGTHIDPDMTEAFKWCEKAAKMGDVSSQYRLAIMYEDGIGTEKDIEAARKWNSLYLINVAIPNIMESWESIEYSGKESVIKYDSLMDKLMTTYDEGAVARSLKVKFNDRRKIDGKQLFDLCNEYCTTERNKGFIGRCYLEGVGVECNEKEAFRLYSVAANAGDAESMYVLSSMYRHGIGTEKDYEQYERWLRLAARFGQLNAVMIVRRKDLALEKSIRKTSKRSLARRK